jgi:hypothetical protein
MINDNGNDSDDITGRTLKNNYYWAGIQKIRYVRFVMASSADSVLIHSIYCSCKILIVKRN